MKAVQLTGHTIQTLDQGHGPPLLFVHGFPLDHTLWDAQIKRFVGSNRVIAPDLRGFGESAPAGSLVHMTEYADDLNALLDALGVSEPVVLCGLSMGGYIAWPFVRKYADRLGALVICDSRAVADTPEAAQGRHNLAEQVERNGMDPVEKAFLPKLMARRVYETRPDVVAAVQTMIRGVSPQGAAAALRGMAARPDVSEMLPSIRIPTLLIGGTEDGISTPAEMRGIAAAIPGARFVEIANAGHLTPIEQPSAFDDALATALR